jgi:hypothetical protein
MAKKFNLKSFLKLSPEQQAQEIEKQTKELLKRLPTLKKRLKMYDDTSSELYNLKSDELELIGSSYAKAVRSGEITTPTAKQSYNRFIRNLQKYARTDISYLARQTAKKRMDSWIDNVQNGINSNESDYEYAKELLDSMTDDEIEGFTRSKFFMDSSYMYMITEEDNVQYSIQTLKLELYLEEIRGKSTRHIYRNNVKGDEGKLRKYTLKRFKKK